MSGRAALRLMPDGLRTMRRTVEVHAPTEGPAGSLRATLWFLLLGAECAALALAALIPGPEHVTAHVPESGALGGFPPAQGWPSPDAGKPIEEPDEPLVPRRPVGHPRAPHLPG